MNRDEFLNQLERLLMDIPEGDRLDAIEYYYDYFDEAGVANEQKVIRELGSPERVAQTIKENLGTNGFETSSNYGGSGDYNEPKDYSAPDDSERSREYGDAYDSANPYEQTKSYGSTESYENSYSAPKNGTSGKKTSWVLIAIIAVLTFPLWIGIIAGLFGGLMGLIGGLIGLVFGLFGASIGLIVGGIACCIAMIYQAAVVGPAEALVAIGVSLLLVALGLLFALLLVWLVAKWIPYWVKAIVNGIKGLMKRK